MSAQFTFNGISSDTYGIRYRAHNRQVYPGIRSKMTEIVSKNGAYNFGSDTSGLIQNTVTIMYIGSDTNNLQRQLRLINAWLYSSTWGKLTFGDEPDKFYYAQVVDGFDMESLLTIGECEITFLCQPFAYMVIDTGDDLTWEEADMPWVIEIPWLMSDEYTYTVTAAANCVFNNPGTKPTNYKSPQGSKFDIIITGTFTTLSLVLNGSTLNYTEAVSSGTLTIDNTNMEVDLNGTNKLSKTTGDLGKFLEAVPGENILAVTGTGLNVSIQIDLKPEWI